MRASATWQNPVEFRVKARDVLVIQQLDGLECIIKPPYAQDLVLSLKTKNFSTLQRSCKEFEDSANTTDLRSLLTHFEKMLSLNHSLYPSKNNLNATVKKLKRCCLTLIHRNAHVLPLDKALSPTTICERENRVVELFFRYLRDFVSNLPQAPNTASLKRSPDINSCFNLFNASREHLRSVEHIILLYNAVFRIPAIEEDPIDRVEILDQLIKDNFFEARQLVLYFFWARFGIDNDQEEDTLFTEEAPKQAKFRVFQRPVYRHKIDLQGTTINLIQSAHFAIDPIGITNLDICNRALDVAFMCIRKCLFHLADNISEPNAAWKNIFRQISALNCDEVYGLEGAALDEDLDDIFHYQRKPLKQGQTLADFWCEQMYGDVSIRTDLQVFAQFLKYCPNFADPRFTFKTLSEIKDSLGIPMFPLMLHLVRLRDSSNHHIVLKNPIKRDYKTTYADVERALTSVKEFSRGIALDQVIQDWPEWKALLELKMELFGKTNTDYAPYRRWRSRQSHIAEFTEEKATDQAILALGRVKVIINDANVDDSHACQDAVKHLLKYCQEPIRKKRNAPKIRSSSVNFETPNLFDILRGPP